MCLCNRLCPLKDERKRQKSVRGHEERSWVAILVNFPRLQLISETERLINKSLEFAVLEAVCVKGMTLALVGTSWWGVLLCIYVQGWKATWQHLKPGAGAKPGLLFVATFLGELYIVSREPALAAFPSQKEIFFKDLVTSHSAPPPKGPTTSSHSGVLASATQILGRQPTARPKHLPLLALEKRGADARNVEFLFVRCKRPRNEFFPSTSRRSIVLLKYCFQPGEIQLFLFKDLFTLKIRKGETERSRLSTGYSLDGPDGQHRPDRSRQHAVWFLVFEALGPSSAVLSRLWTGWWIRSGSAGTQSSALMGCQCVSGWHATILGLRYLSELQKVK